jgi:hypothetical protein
MAFRKPGIPAVNTPDRTLNQAISAIKENIETINGARIGIGEIVTLDPTASLSDVVSKINEIIARLNASGQ